MKILLYCTKAKPYLVKRNIFAGVEPSYFILKENVEDRLNGKIVAECDFEVEEIEYSLIVANNKPYHYYEPQNTFVDKFYDKSCLNHQQVEEYLGYKNGYAIHIKNLKIFDKPRELNEYTTRKPQTYDSIICDSCNNFGFDCKKCSSFYDYQQVMKAPQNMMYAYDNELNKYILISIQPQWLCKILNGEKTIEIRKKVLKEMIK